MNCRTCRLFYLLCKQPDIARLGGRASLLPERPGRRKLARAFAFCAAQTDSGAAPATINGAIPGRVFDTSQ
jgi:hypothetical protein